MYSSKHVTLAAIALMAALLTGSSSAEAQSRSSAFGLGGMVGDPFGLSMKLRLGDMFAIDFGVGWEAWGYGRYGDDSFQAHADFVWAIDLVSLPRTDMSVYFGLGPQVQFDDDDDPNNDRYDGHWWGGGRFPVGLDWDFKRRQLDVFVEFAPGFLVGEHDYWDPGDTHVWFETDFSAGARYWF